MSAPTIADFSVLLFDALGYTAEEFVALGYEDNLGGFRTAVMAPEDAVGAAARLPATANAYFGVNPTKGPARTNAGRGTEATVTRLAALWCDLDVKPGACASLDVAKAIIANLSIALGTRPTILVYSGGGMHAYWPISDGHTLGNLDAARAVLRRWGRTVATMADALDAKADNVFDLSRMLRLPGSQNNKIVGEPRPVTAELDTGGPLTIAEVTERLDELGIGHQDDDTRGAGEEICPPAEWSWADRTCPYVAAMVTGFSTDTPKLGAGRNPWMLSQKVRLASAHRLGCITADDYTQATQTLENRFTEIVRTTSPPREPKRLEFRDTTKCAIAKAAAKTEQEARAELGSHTHDTSQPDANSRPAEVHSGQARMAYRVADRYAGKMVHVSGLGWFRWDATRFAPDDRGAAKRAVLAELRRALGESIGDKELRADVRKCESSSGVGGVLDLAAALEPFASVVADLDADPYLLNVANGTLDLRTLELRPHNPADRITKVCRGAYTPDTNSVLWEAFLARILPDEAVRGFVQRLVGVGLLGTVREHVLSIWTGQGANGKSVLDKAIRNALGDYACTAEPDLFMHREGAHPTGEMDLRGVRWVAVSESEKDRRLAEATMKRLTGGDTIRARRMRQDFVEFTPSHTPTLITNHLPRVSGDDPAIWRRIRVVPFDVVIPDAEQDPQLDDRLALEADAILTWAVQGHRDYLDRGLDEPAGVRVATDTYHRNSDAVARFIDECCHTGPAVKSITGQLFAAWDKWRTRDGAEQMSLKAFGLALTSKGFPLPAKTANGQRWRQGISLRPDEDAFDFDE